MAKCEARFMGRCLIDGLNPTNRGRLIGVILLVLASFLASCGDQGLASGDVYDMEEEFSRHIASGKNIDEPMERFKTRLHYSVCYGNDKAVRLLLKHGANPHQLIYGDSLLQIAAGYGYEQVVRTLMEHNVSIKPPMSETNDAVIRALRDGNPTLAEAIANRYLTPDRMSPVHLVGLGLIEEFRLRGVSTKAALELDGEWTLLHYAAANNQVVMLKELLALGVPVDVGSEYDSAKTPIWVAAAYGATEAVEHLLTRGARINYPRPSRVDAPLHVASMYGHTKVVTALLKAGASVHAFNDVGQQPLHTLIVGDPIERRGGPSSPDDPWLYFDEPRRRANMLKIAELLLQHGASIDQHTVYPSAMVGLRPIHCAAYREYPEVFDYLLSRGAFPDYVEGDQRGRVPLMAAVTHPKMVRSLLRHGVNINRQDADGNSALHFAVEYESPDSAKALIMAGANVHLINRDCVTAWENIAEEDRGKYQAFWPKK